MRALETAGPPFSTTGLARLVAGAIAAASMVAPGAFARDTEPDPFVSTISASEEVRVHAVLSKCQSAGMMPEPTAHELVALGESAWDAAFALLVIARESRLDEEEGDGTLPSDPTREETLLAFGSAIGPRPLFDLLDRVARRARRVDLRVAAVRLLAERADAGRIPLLWRCATPSASGSEAAEPFLAPLQSALTRTLRRDPKAFHAVEFAWPSLDARLLEAVIRSLGESGDARALPTILAMLDRTQDQNGLLLAQVERLGPRLSRENARLAAERVRSCLDPSDPTTCRAAALALGWLLDRRGVPQLVEMLDSGAPQSRDAALWALRRISGLDLREKPARWAAWHREETAWFDERADVARRSLRSPDEPGIAATLEEIAQHPLFRDEFVWCVSNLLEHPTPGIRLLACEVLVQLGTTEAVPSLIAALEDSDPILRERALAALRRITGLDVPADPQAWRVALSAADARTP